MVPVAANARAPVLEIFIFCLRCWATARCPDSRLTKSDMVAVRENAFVKRFFLDNLLTEKFGGN